MAWILNLETATKNCSVALARDGELVALREVAEVGYTHAERLHVFIEECLSEANIGFTDLDAIAVSEGPGSYTGLRIGVSAAKGLCYALGKPLLAVPTLEILAHAVDATDGSVVAMLDARRMEAYTAVFSAGKQVRETQPEILTSDSFADLPGPIYIAGDAQHKFRDLSPKGDFRFCSDISYPSAAHMARLTFDCYKKSDTVDVAYFEPVYLKEFFLPGKL